MTFYKASFTDKIIQVNQMQTSDEYELDMLITACLFDLENHTVVFSTSGFLQWLYGKYIHPKILT